MQALEADLSSSTNHALLGELSRLAPPDRFAEDGIWLKLLCVSALFLACGHVHIFPKQRV